MDQGFVYVDLGIRHNGKTWEFHYPLLPWAGGITASLLVGLYKLVVPTSVDTLNYHVKILTAILFLTSSFLLAQAFLANKINQIIAVAIVASSGLQILEPSTEAISASFLNIFVLGVKRGWTPLAQALFLSLFSLVKAEMVLIGVSLSLVYLLTAPQTWRQKTIFSCAYACFLLLFLFPSFYLYGITGVSIGQRGFGAIEWKLCTLLVHASTNNLPCVNGKLVGASSFAEFVLQNPRSYTDIVIQSFPEVLKRAIYDLGAFWLFFPVGLFLCRKIHLDPTDRFLIYVTGAAFIITFLMCVLVGYAQPRYWIRFYCILAVGTLLCWEKARLADERLEKHIFPIFVALIGLSLICQNLVRIGPFMAHPHSF
jgi:hypothetical protein